MQGKKHN